MIKEYDPAGIVDLSELDELAYVGGADVQPAATPVIATVLVSIISIEATATVFSYAFC